MKFSFVHAADLHIDSPLEGLTKYEGAPVERIKSSIRSAFINLIDFCIVKKVNFLLLAGDIFDGDWKDHNTGLFFNTQMNRLKKNNIKVYIIRGNHDAESHITKNLPYPSNVYEFPTNKPDTIFIQNLGVAIHGQGFANRSVSDNLAKDYPHAVSGMFNIGLLHTSLAGREGHDTYAPCTEDTLISKGYDYWALGHIHKREIINSNATCIVYPGNLQGRHIKEIDEKGCVLVQVSDGIIESVENHILDVIRWSVCDIDVSSFCDIYEIYSEVKDRLQKEVDKCDDKLLIVRVLLTGSTEFHKELMLNQLQIIEDIRSIALDVALNDIYIEKVKISTSNKISIGELFKRNPVINELFQYMDELLDDDEFKEEISNDFYNLKKILPPSVLSKNEVKDIDSSASVSNYMKEIKERILYEMVMKEGAK